jgi:hypothetical protein
MYDPRTHAISALSRTTPRSETEYGKRPMKKIAICYVCPVVKWEHYEALAHRFISTYTAFPPEYPHELHVIWNGGEPPEAALEIFSEKNAVFHRHDNTGWDVGAVRKISGVLQSDLMLVLGANSYFKRAGWLRRIMEAHDKYGAGLYGTSASFDTCPHIRTHNFLCSPQLIAAWKGKISKPLDRRHFEVGHNSLTALTLKAGMPCVLVAWDGFYFRDEWRKPPHIFRRGDQSNCLIYDRHHELYESSSAKEKIQLSRIADGDKLEFYRAAIRRRLSRLFKPNN